MKLSNMDAYGVQYPPLSAIRGMGAILGLRYLPQRSVYWLFIMKWVENIRYSMDRDCLEWQLSSTIEKKFFF